MKRYLTIAAAALCVGGAALAGGPAKGLDYAAAVDWLAQQLNGASFEYDGYTPGKLTLGFEAREDGSIVVRQSIEREKPDLGFRSHSEESWTFYLSDLNPKLVKVRFAPPSVFVATKGKRGVMPQRIQVERTERKTAAETIKETPEQWTESDRFTTNFVAIPVTDAAMAERVAEVLRRAIEQAPEPEL